MTQTNDGRHRLLVDIPLPIKRAAAKRATSNLNDELVGVLARRFEAKFTPTGYNRGTLADPSGGKTLLRVPAALKRKIVRAAVKNETNQTIEVCRALAEEYGVPYRPASGRRAPVGGGRRRRHAAAA